MFSFQAKKAAASPEEKVSTNPTYNSSTHLLTKSSSESTEDSIVKVSDGASSALCSSSCDYYSKSTTSRPSVMSDRTSTTLNTSRPTIMSGASSRSNATSKYTSASSKYTSASSRPSPMLSRPEQNHDKSHRENLRGQKDSMQHWFGMSVMTESCFQSMPTASASVEDVPEAEKISEEELSVKATMDDSAVQLEVEKLPTLTRLTPLHQLCMSATSAEELMEGNNLICHSSATKPDALGRLPLHCLSYNVALIDAVAFGFNNSCTNSNNEPISPRSGTYTNAPVEGQLIEFVSRLFQVYPASMISPDVNGCIPFEGTIADWVEEATAFEEQGLSREPTLARERFASLWNKSMNRFSKSSRSLGRLEISSTKSEVDAESVNAISSPRGKSSNDHTHMRLTASAFFGFQMLSATLEFLEAARGQLELPNKEDGKPAASWGLQDSTIIDISDEIVRSIACIPKLIYVIMMIEDFEQRHYLLSTKLMQRVLSSKYSVGIWLTDMLQSQDKHKSFAAIEYLHLVSEMKQDVVEDPKRHTASFVDSHRSKQKASEGEVTRAISQLESFIPSLLSLPHKQVEDAATTSVVRRVLDTIMSCPFCVTIVFCDALFLAVLVTGFRMAVNHLITGSSPKDVSKYLYIANMAIYYFIIRELGKAVSLYTITRRARIYFLSFWNVTDLVSTILALVSVCYIRSNFKEGEATTDVTGLRNLLAVTTGFIWLRILNFLKGINIQLATFVLAITQIAKDVLWFCVIVLTLVIAFSQMFFTVLAPEPKECQANEDLDTCKESEYFLNTYLLMIFQEFDRDVFTTTFSVVLLVAYSFIVVLVILNVLIAVASDSYEKCLVRSDRLFGRARVMMVTEFVCFQNLLRRNSKKREASAQMYKPWWIGESASGWSRASILFFGLASLITICWVLAEGFQLKFGPNIGTKTMGFASAAVIFGLFFGILAFLSSPKGNSFNTDIGSDNLDKNNWFQRTMLRILGSSREASRINSDWKGRVVYLKNEMAKISYEAQADTNERLALIELTLQEQIDDVKQTLTEMIATVNPNRDQMMNANLVGMNDNMILMAQTMASIERKLDGSR